jgi:23S rRNA-/tRNA-specific pseudouridylate synthase
MKFDIIFENDILVAVNKPQVYCQFPDREGKEISLKQTLQHKHAKYLPFIRLDKATTWCDRVCKDEITHKELHCFSKTAAHKKFTMDWCTEAYHRIKEK